MAVLLLNFQAPLMSFGAPQVDYIGPTGRFPTLSMVTGLLGNALGFRHGDHAHLQALQGRVRLASALIEEGQELEDYQTVDLGQAHLRRPAWTTRGKTEHRAGGPAARFGTHIRKRRYRAGAKALVAISLVPAEHAPTLPDLARALERPSRPLFLGRKNCLPAAPILFALDTGSTTLNDALQRAPASFPDRWTAGFGPSSRASVTVERPISDERSLSSTDRRRVQRVMDERDWSHGLHGGERAVLRERVALSWPAPAPAETV